MKNSSIIKSLLLNLIIAFFLIGLYSCGGSDNSTKNTDSDTEEGIIKVEDEGSTYHDNVDSEMDETLEGDERDDLSISSKSKDAELEVELENPGFEGTYNYVDVDEPPMFEECEEKVTDEEKEKCFHKFLMNNISRNIKYPESAKELNVEGKVYVAFVIDKTGLISKTKVVRGSGYEYESSEEPINEYIDAYKDLDAAAVEAIKQTQKIKPAMVANDPVSVQYTIPVSFKIE